MTIQIETLHKEDFQECIDFINMVFSMSSNPTNFPELLPAYYQETEEHMLCHRVLREQGRIKALVGIYPGSLQIGSTSLTVARVGAVSTHPYSQGRGYMRQLMNHCVDEIRSQYDLSHLGGLRLRYLYFGYDRCGFVPTFTLNENTLKHAGVAGSVEWQDVTAADHGLLLQMLRMHDRQTIRSLRTLDQFYSILHNWNHYPIAALREGQLVGYVVTNSKRTQIAELVAEDPQTALILAQSLLQTSGNQELEVVLSPAQPEMIRYFDQACDDVQIGSGGNWQVLQWKKTLEALFRVKQQLVALTPGSLILDIHGGEKLQITVSGTETTVKPTDLAPDIAGSSHEMMRLFFGPLAPEMTSSEAGKHSLIQSWLPLPLYLPQQDHA